MDEFIKLLDPAYELIQYRIKENKVIFHIASTITEPKLFTEQYLKR